jgi:hypothetical protein
MARGSQPASERVTLIVGPSTVAELASSSDEQPATVRDSANTAMRQRRGTGFSGSLG